MIENPMIRELPEPEPQPVAVCESPKCCQEFYPGDRVLQVNDRRMGIRLFCSGACYADALVAEGEAEWVEL